MVSPFNHIRSDLPPAPDGFTECKYLSLECMGVPFE